MLDEVLWRNRLVLVSLILFAWELIFAAITSFSYGTDKITLGIVFIVGFFGLCVGYYLWHVRIKNLVLNFGKMIDERIQILLYSFYLVVIYGVIIKSLPLSLHPEYFVNSATAIFTKAGSILSILILIAFGVIFNRWHVSLKNS